MIVHDFVYDLQLILGFSARKTELNGMHGRLLKVEKVISFGFKCEYFVMVLLCYEIPTQTRH